MDHPTLLIILACTLGFFMTWGVGANDLANVMSTTLGSRSISIRQMIIFIIIFEFAGAYLGGEQVAETLRSGIINSNALNLTAPTLVSGMLAVLLAGSTWMFIASYFGLPVSITHTIIGAMVGFAAIVLGTAAVYWREVEIIGFSWLFSPLLSGMMAYGLFLSLQKLIFNKPNPFPAAKRWAPFYLFLIGITFSLVSVLKGLSHLGFRLTVTSDIAITLGMGVTMVAMGLLILRTIHCRHDCSRRAQFAYTEKIFAVLMIFTACAMVFAHGSNDVANAVGPMAAIISVVQSNGNMAQTSTLLPPWIIGLGCIGVIMGLLMYGRKVIATVGSGITTLTPSRAFAATLAAATTVVMATGAGIPVSATQTLVGAILGVGLARGIGALNLRVVRHIFASWLITIPAGASLAILYFFGFRWLLAAL